MLKVLAMYHITGAIFAGNGIDINMELWGTYGMEWEWCWDGYLINNTHDKIPIRKRHARIYYCNNRTLARDWFPQGIMIAMEWNGMIFYCCLLLFLSG